MHDDVVARGYAGDPGAHRAHDARAVGARHDRRGHARPAARDDAQVAAVERRRAQVDHDLARPRHELRPVLDGGRLRPSELAHYQRLRHARQTNDERAG